MKVVAVCNQKGGVGKTTLTFHLGWGLYEFGHRVLMIDNDPQGNLSVCCDVSSAKPDCPVRMVYRKPPAVEWLPVPPSDGDGERKGALSLVSSNNTLAGVEWRPDRYVEFSLRKALRREADEGGGRGGGRETAGRGEGGAPSEGGRETAYFKGSHRLSEESMGSGPSGGGDWPDIIARSFDFVLIDCPPSLGVLTAAAFNASDYLIIPTLPDPLSLYGLADILANVDEVHELRINTELRVAGIVVNQVKNTKVSREAVDALEAQAPAHVFTNMLPERTVIQQTKWNHLPIWRYQKSSDISEIYMNLIKEIEAVVIK